MGWPAFFGWIRERSEAACLGSRSVSATAGAVRLKTNAKAAAEAQAPENARDSGSRASLLHAPAHPIRPQKTSRQNFSSFTPSM
ncbi:hypothetical protein BC351_30400 [Paenibacillus ferrarius]|uniref:Uncharacterized protein n=1 Tax=Paenibacillus ferrarius TaxID=1469647 RepID=A0A1V4HH97_9BACL|nr:hypothetical protein BC351_30400 [Paenibacillus ferrarius]